MPAPLRAAILTPEQTRFRFGIEPVINGLYSLILLTRVDELSGLDPWIVRTVERLDPDKRKRNILVLWGLHYALTPDRSWNTFTAYVDHLSAAEPEALRDKLIHAYLTMPHKPELPGVTMEQVLESEQGFLDFLRSRFEEENVIEEIEREAYKLLMQPKRMQTVIVSHLREMWDEVLKAEWERTLPLIRESVAAFEQVDLAGMADEEVVRYVTGQASKKWSDWHFEDMQSLVFVPSPHAGPYIGAFHGSELTWILFGARQPQGVQQGISDLSRAELLVWLSALSDDTRLRILGLIRERGELCAQDLIDLLEVSQSSCSRHLRQLSASGFLIERRTEAGKCYSLNLDRIQDTARAIEGYAA